MRRRAGAKLLVAAIEMGRAAELKRHPNDLGPPPSVEQNKEGNWQGAESINVSVAVWCGMKMVPSPAKQIRQPSFLNGERAEPMEIWKARKFIQEHSDEKIGLTKVAKFVNISANQLSEKFKQVTGVNFVDYVACQRIEKAHVLLLDVDLRVSEIAFATGFQSLSQFNRVFKKLSGKSPTQYRATHVKHRRQ